MSDPRNTYDLAADLAAFPIVDATGIDDEVQYPTDPETAADWQTAPEGWEGPFRLQTDRMAEWAFRKRLIAADRIAEAEEVASAERHRVQTWLDGATARHRRDVAFFDGLLERYAMEQRAEHDRKSISTPHGTVTTRATKATGKVRDEAALIAALRAADLEQLVTTTEHAPSVAALVRDGVLEVTDAGAVLKASGELLPVEVVEVTPERVNVTVTT